MSLWVCCAARRSRMGATHTRSRLLPRTLNAAASATLLRRCCDAAATLGMLEMENDAMGLVAQAGVSVPEPLAGKSGSKIIRLEQLGGACEETGTCFVRLITFLGGTLLAEVPE